LNRSPPELIHEIILVDDFSDKRKLCAQSFVTFTPQPLHYAGHCPHIDTIMPRYDVELVHTKGQHRLLLLDFKSGFLGARTLG